MKTIIVLFCLVHVNLDVILDRNLLSKWIPSYQKNSSLFLDHKNITSIAPHTFDGLTQLVTLSLTSNGLTSLNDSSLFKDLKNLQVLQISNNKLALLNEDIFKSLTNLQTLDMGLNQQTNLVPTLFLGLKNLAYLFLDRNRLSKLDDSLIFVGLNKLNTLTLNSNRLTSLNPAIVQSLTSLEYLWLSDNNFAKQTKESFISLNLCKLSKSTSKNCQVFF